MTIRENLKNHLSFFPVSNSSRATISVFVFLLVHFLYIRTPIAIFNNATMLKRELDAVFFVSAARYGRLEKVSAMVEAGADVNAVGDENYTALHVAVLRNHAKVIEFLVRAGADVFAKNDAGETPFGLAQKVGGAASLAICGVQLVRHHCVHQLIRKS